MDYVLANIPLTCTLVGVIGVLFAIALATVVKAAPAGNEKMQEIAAAIQEGAIAYLNRQLKSMSIVGAIIFVIIFAYPGPEISHRLSDWRSGLFYRRLCRHESVGYCQCQNC